MKQIIFTTALLIGLIMACRPVIDDDDPPVIPPAYGSLEFRFIMPSYRIPKEGVHRVTLGFAYKVDSLYRGEFFKKINVSDYQEVYNVLLLPGEYYYDAVITCSCGGDTCLNGSFPGGRYGMKHNFDKFTISQQETTVIETHFD